MAKNEVTAILPGMFYRKPSPDEPFFKNDGDSVEEGEVIGLIEVMKSFHEVRSEFSGTIAFKLGDSEPISPGVVIAEINTSD